MTDRVAQLEARLARIEQRLGIEPLGGGAASPTGGSNAASSLHGAGFATPVSAGDLERSVEQSGFAVAGVVALTIGAGFMLAQPHSNLPAAVPSIVGAALAAGLLLAAHFGERRFGLLANSLRGAGLVLLFFAALRLSFFGATPALDLRGTLGRTLLVLPVALSAALAWSRRSPGLAALSLVLGCAGAIAINTGEFLIVALPLLTSAVVAAALVRGWPALPLVGAPLLYLTHFVWACGNPILGGRYHYSAEPAAAPLALLIMICLFAATALFRAHREHEDGVTNAAALLNCFFGYGVFLVHTAAAFPRHFAMLHASAFAVFLGIAVLFWTRERARVSTFFYVLTGYVALSMAILKASAIPEVFVWLSLQSVVVVATAVWFRSRLIVVANFLIYAAIILGYMFIAKAETGISLGFGIVALVSARILGWQKDRLELKTELMRNAYLFSALVIFPYGLHHLVPPRYIALSWVGLAVGYYLLNLIVRSEKYRWMGHATLALAAIFIVFAGPGQLAPVYRVASFVALGTVLLIVSLSFPRVRR